MNGNDLEQIEQEVVTLLRRADFKRTLDGSQGSMDRSAYLILKKLKEKGHPSIGDVADFFQLNYSTASRQVAALESHGLIRRFTERNDARVSLIEMTSVGAELLAEVHTKRLKEYEEILMEWTEEEMCVFAQLLSRLNRTLEKRRRLG